MNKNQDTAMSFYNILVIEISVALIVTAIIGVWKKSIWWGLISFVLILISYPLVAWFFKVYRRLAALKKTGITCYYEKFDSKTDCNIFSKDSQVRESFCYFGASSNSILELVKQWTINNATINTYRFLLMDPESEKLKKQIAFENNIPESIVAEDVIETEKMRIKSAIKVLKNLRPYTDRKMEIKLYSNFVPWWFYIIDDRMIYLGVLEKGKRGDEPVILTEKLDDSAILFDLYKNTWDCAWSDATKVD